MAISTVDPSVIDPTPKDVPQAITSPGTSDTSWEIRLTCPAGEQIISANNVDRMLRRGRDQQ